MYIYIYIYNLKLDHYSFLLIRRLQFFIYPWSRYSTLHVIHWKYRYLNYKKPT